MKPDVRFSEDIRSVCIRDVNPLAWEICSAAAEPHYVLARSVAYALIAVRRHPRKAAKLVGSPLLALGIAWILKSAIDRRRPPSHLFKRHGLESFPSTHTAGSAALACALIDALPVNKKARAAAITAVTAEIAAIGFLRVGVGAHWLSDVVAGAAIGVGAALFVRRLLRHRNRP